MELLYFASPLCSWCWGFQPSLHALRERWPGLSVTLALGPLHPDWAGRTLKAAEREQLRGWWQRVAETSGQPFALERLARDDWRYDPRPPARAVLVMRALWPALQLAFFERLQERFYAHGDDLADPAVLRAVAVGEFGVEGEAFDRLWQDPALDRALAREWRDVERLGVAGYPTLLALAHGRVRPVTAGWLAPAALVARLEAVARELDAPLTR